RQPNGQAPLITRLVGRFAHPNLQVFSGKPRLDLRRETHGAGMYAPFSNTIPLMSNQYEVSKAEWIEVKAVQNPAGLYSAQRKYGLGPGEMSTILLAKELGANPVLLDDYKARKVAKAEGLGILGSIGLLETFYLRRYFTDLRSVFQELVAH